MVLDNMEAKLFHIGMKLFSIQAGSDRLSEIRNPTAHGLYNRLGLGREVLGKRIDIIEHNLCPPQRRDVAQCRADRFPHEIIGNAEPDEKAWQRRIKASLDQLIRQRLMFEIDGDECKIVRNLYACPRHALEFAQLRRRLIDLEDACSAWPCNGRRRYHSPRQG